MLWAQLAGGSPGRKERECALTDWLAFMTRNDGPKALYLVQAYAALVLGTALIGMIAVSVFSAPELQVAASGGGVPQPAQAPPVVAFVLVWPAVSSLVLWGVLEGLRRVLPTYWHVAGAAALVFGGLFTWLTDLQGGLIFTWPYFIYALTFLAWHLRSTLEGLVMTFALQVAAHLTLSVLVFAPVR
jgi:hypothetical protein